MAKRKGSSDPVVRFRVLSDERVRCQTLAAWRNHRDLSQYLRWLVDQDWRRYERATRGDQAA